MFRLPRNFLRARSTGRRSVGGTRRLSILPLKCARIQRAKQWRNCATRFKCAWMRSASSRYANRGLLYQGGVVLAPGKYQLKFLAREMNRGGSERLSRTFSCRRPI